MDTSTPITDEWLQQAVLAELKAEGRVEPSAIGVAVEDSIVTLTGHVHSCAERIAAEEAAQRVPGVRAVANDVEIPLPLDTALSDTELAAAIVRALEREARLPMDHLEISVAHGWVALKGEVPRPCQRQDAERVARCVSGVKGVTNLIAVQPCASSTDLRQRIGAALAQGAVRDTARIHVEVQGSRVVLGGTVRSWAEQNDAERAAWSAPGVEAVDNRLVVTIPTADMHQVV
jgi:osmotically-inducible protein OsmY